MLDNAYRTGSEVLSRLPLGAVRTIGLRGGRLAHRRWDDRRAMAERHMARILGGDPDRVDDAARAAARAVFDRYGTYVAETLWLRQRHLDRIWRETAIGGKEHFDDAIAAGGGVVLALPHVGNWEFAAVYPLLQGVRLVAVAEDLADAEMTAWFTRMRAEVGIEVELAGASGLTRRLAGVLREGGAVALVTDRDVTGTGIGVDFFGERTRMPAGPGALARLTGAPLLPVACYIDDEGGHRITAAPPIEVARTKDRAADTADAVQDLAVAFEDLIRVDPTQWHLLQPQWPSDPGYRWGEPG